MEELQRLEMLVGRAGIHRLQQSHVVVVGLGGVGGHAAEALARSGIGRLSLVDFDRVSVSNINRQLVASHKTLGQAKTAVMAARIADLHPYCCVQTWFCRHQADAFSPYLEGPPDFLIDAIDRVGDKVDLIQQCLAQKIPIISSMGAGNKLDPTLLRVADISETHTCPLAKVIRRELRLRGIKRGLPVVFSLEPPVRISAAGQMRPPPGSSAFVPPAAGLTAAGFVVRNLLKQ